MPKDVDIQPGSTFHLPAAQDKNVGNLMSIFGKKEATQALTEMAKTKPSTWTEIKNTVGDLKQITASGGIGTMVSSFKEMIALQIQDTLSPLTNEINQAIADQMKPMMDLLSPIINELSTFLADNKVGAGIGGIAGEIASGFLPGGKIWTILGPLIGAVIEGLLRSFLGGTIVSEEEFVDITGKWGLDISDTDFELRTRVTQIVGALMAQAQAEGRLLSGQDLMNIMATAQAQAEEEFQ